MKKKKSNPYLVIINAFIIFLAIGTLLLSLPIAQKQPTSFVDCLFIATSAFTVTGLATIDITANFNTLGHIIIMILVQAGGLGIITLAMIVFIMLGRKVGLKSRSLATEALNQQNLGGILRLVLKLLLISLLFESIGAVLLALEWVPLLGVKRGLFNSFFTAVSAFNNAGFALHSDNLVQYQTNPVINFIITTLILLGGLGFTVILDLYQKKKFSHLRLHTKIMIFGTLIINTIATLSIYLLEMNNLKTLGGHNTLDQFQMAYFQAITTRTAGFNTIDIGALETPTILLMMLFMFIGGGSTSTAGGIKLTTAVIIFFGTISFIKQREQISLFKRAIDTKYLFKSFAIVVLSSTFIFFITLALVIAEPDLPFLAVMFEVISAFGTVGLTMGITAKLSVAGKLLIILMMMIGKIGVLTIVLTFSKPQKALYSYPKEDVLTG
ncbi:Ktr system potassium transporter B [Macrococcoides canis]|uniref:Ktr system potassium transporter B n=1 Tax=Macrococcoides canis TaxID=1855823 RepID=A0A4R6C4E0_9STAP|nr:TrkH family potassium uptake protein [Macrococcus canis]MEE1106915.1 TrkH family potassium uptake protein [Macrococcus canis]TDM16588.1 Ktr system potassium transporter B [Macrococcus canis]TDM19726.1 Ktr system potassium transporter B [Macrococcus canis]TDM22475.1 Ktr system potassium transporter B [Macrococcus canis]TDM36043.1 Ktr system potassium transporter B [Macrococcus canis]